MKLFERRKKKSADVIQSAPRRFSSHPFALIEGYTPLSEVEIELYSSLKEALPIIDAAIQKIIRLLGTFTVECDNPEVKSMIDGFFRDVNICNGNVGIMNFITSYFEDLITFGQAIGEIVLSPDNKEILGLYNASLKDVGVCNTGNPLDIAVYRRDTSGDVVLPYQDLIVSTLLNPESGRCRGTSLLKGLPFVSGILLKIFQSVGQNWDRAGNIRFAVTYKPDKENSSQAYTRENAELIANEWSRVMSSTQNCDFVSVGDISISTIGADNPVLDCDIPIRRVTEQIVAKLGIPPFMLGLSWSTTERMSSQQADILTSELEYYRTILNPVILRIVRTFLNLKGIDEDVEVYWNHINLQDELEISKARLNNANALKIEREIENMYGIRESEEGLIEEV